MVNTTSGEAMLFVDDYVIEHTKDIWLAWAGTLAIMLLPGKSEQIE